MSNYRHFALVLVAVALLGGCMGSSQVTSRLSEIEVSSVKLTEGPNGTTLVRVEYTKKEGFTKGTISVKGPDGRTIDIAYTRELRRSNSVELNIGKSPPSGEYVVEVQTKGGGVVRKTVRVNQEG